MLMLTVREAAGRTGVSDGLVRAWVKAGELPHYRLGAKGRRGKIAIATDDLDAFLAARRVEAAPPRPERKPRKNDDDFSAYYQKVMAEVERRRQR